MNADARRYLNEMGTLFAAEERRETQLYIYRKPWARNSEPGALFIGRRWTPITASTWIEHRGTQIFIINDTSVTESVRRG